MSKSSKKKLSAKYFTILISSLLALLIAFSVALPVVAIGSFDPVLRDFFKEAKTEDSITSDEDPEGLDLIYNKSDFSSKEALAEYRSKTARQVAADGYVLLKNDNDVLPLNKSKTVSLFSHSSVDMLGGGTGSGRSSVSGTFKDAFTAQGYTVNETLWNFYESGKGKDYVRGVGVINYGSGEDWSINECPLSELRNNNVLDSAKGTTPIFVISRSGGEGSDLARSMIKHTKIAEDQQKHYLELDSIELEILKYLNENFTDIVIILNTLNPFELGFLESNVYGKNVKSVLWVAGGGTETYSSVVDVLSGAVNPSARLVDTFAYDNLDSSPAMQNMGDIAYTVNGSTTNYYGISYDESIYVGYKYYETRYFDKVMEQGNAGDYDYAKTVQYPFGYGLSYTNFTWSNFGVSAPDDNGDITVSVTVKNDGSVSGRDVVEVYLNAPYTTFDKQNKLEKSATSLVGFTKTPVIAAGESVDVKVTVNVSDFITYDDVVNKTYILEAGDYLLTAAKDAHAATNNFLAYNEKSVGGDKTFVGKYTATETDTATYAKSEAGETVENRFESESINYIDRDKYLTRSDWVGSYPKTHGKASEKESGFSERGNVTYYEEVTQGFIDKLAAKQTSQAANNPETDAEAAAKALPVGQEGDLSLIDLRGKDFDDPLWDKLIQQVTNAELKTMVNQSGYRTPQMDSINKPEATDLDGPAGLNNMVGHSIYTIAYPTEINIAASWDGENSYKWGYCVGEDGLLDSVGASGWYAPAMNIHRTPFAGRNFEYFSEDSYISGVMGTEAVKGAASKGMYSFIKHFALNDQEIHRCDNGLATWCNEQAMREIYLKPFQMVMEDSGTVTTRYFEHTLGENGEDVYTEKTTETPASKAVMSAFNRIGYTWAGGDYRLITEILREEWGFNGIVLTDYSQGALSYMHNEQMLRAGGDAALTQYLWGGTLTISDGAVTHYAQKGLKHVLYTVANSNAMNGLVHGKTVAARPFAYYYLIIIAEEVIAVGLIAWGVLAVVKRWKDEKSTPQQETV